MVVQLLLEEGEPVRLQTRRYLLGLPVPRGHLVVLLGFYLDLLPSFLPFSLVSPTLPLLRGLLDLLPGRHRVREEQQGPQGVVEHYPPIVGSVPVVPSVSPLWTAFLCLGVSVLEPVVGVPCHFDGRLLCGCMWC